MFIGSDFDSFSNNFPAFRVTWFCAPTPGFKEISWDMIVWNLKVFLYLPKNILFASWDMIVWKPKSLSTSTQEHDVICRDSVNTGIAPEALVEDVIVREAYKVFLHVPLFYSNNVFHFGHMSTDSPKCESAYTIQWSSFQQERNSIVIKWESETTNILGFRVIYRCPLFWARKHRWSRLDVLHSGWSRFDSDSLGRHNSSKAHPWLRVSASSRSRTFRTTSASWSVWSVLRRWSHPIILSSSHLASCILTISTNVLSRTRWRSPRPTCRSLSAGRSGPRVWARARGSTTSSFPPPPPSLSVSLLRSSSSSPASRWHISFTAQKDIFLSQSSNKKNRALADEKPIHTLSMSMNGLNLAGMGPPAHPGAPLAGLASLGLAPPGQKDWDNMSVYRWGVPNSWKGHLYRCPSQPKDGQKREQGTHVPHGPQTRWIFDRFLTTTFWTPKVNRQRNVLKMDAR